MLHTKTSVYSVQFSEMSYKLYNFYISSCSYRVRIALNFKNLKFEYVPIASDMDSMREVSNLPSLKQVPVLETPSGVLLSQSMAIIDFLENANPASPKLYPSDPVLRAKSLEIAEICNAGIQPLQNRRPMKLMAAHGVSIKDWSYKICYEGMTALEEKLGEGSFSCGEEVSIADVFLRPQVYNCCNRFGVDLNEFPKCKRVVENLDRISAFKNAMPEEQVDYPGPNAPDPSSSK